MPTGDQPQDIIILIISSFMFGVGVALFIVHLYLSKAGPSRRKFQHRKGARFHKPTHIPVKTEPHPYQAIAFLHGHTCRARINVLPITAVLPKVEVKSVVVRKRIHS